MKRLYLLRHAKSSWEDAGLDDIDRPLAPRGEKAAKRIGKYLRDAPVRLDEVLCSSAVRARQTLERLRPFLGPDVAIEFDPNLYGAGPQELLARLHRVDPVIASVMLIGHNPGIQYLAQALVAGDDVGRDQLVEKFPTAAMAELILHIGSWGELVPGEARLERFVLPRTLSS